jgi:hypothetical protein
LPNREKSLQPEDSVGNPARRKKGVLEQKDSAPEKQSVIRPRAIQAGTQAETFNAKVYLRAKYTNDDKELTCQCCQEVMPFLLKSGEYFFEAITCIKSLTKLHHQNRLALCPVCAAMYQHAKETDDKDIQKAIVLTPEDVTFVEVPIKLAGQQYQLRFVGTHSFDLKTLLEVED